MLTTPRSVELEKNVCAPIHQAVEVLPTKQQRNSECIQRKGGVCVCVWGLGSSRWGRRPQNAEATLQKIPEAPLQTRSPCACSQHPAHHATYAARDDGSNTVEKDKPRELKHRERGYTVTHNQRSEKLNTNVVYGGTAVSALSGIGSHTPVAGYRWVGKSQKKRADPAAHELVVGSLQQHLDTAVHSLKDNNQIK